jgi:SAM-dependent methyltransferase
MAKKDNIYKVGNFNDLPFSFNEEVAEVFEDMIDRSVPGYRSSLKLIENFGKKYFQNKSFCYDLGCSLGASTLSLVEAVKEREGQICAVDNSKAMISNCNKKFKHLIDSKKVNFINQDIESTEIKDALMDDRLDVTALASIVLVIGTNDLSAGGTPVRWRHDVQELLCLCLSRFQGIPVLLVGPTPRLDVRLIS